MISPKDLQCLEQATGKFEGFYLPLLIKEGGKIMCLAVEYVFLGHSFLNGSFHTVSPLHTCRKEKKL